MGMSQSVEQPVIEPLETVEESDPEPQEEDEPVPVYESFDWYLSWL